LLQVILHNGNKLNSYKRTKCKI